MTNTRTSVQKDELQQSWVSNSLGEGDKSSSPSTGKPEEDDDYFLSTYTIELNNGEENQLYTKEETGIKR